MPLSYISRVSGWRLVRSMCKFFLNSAKLKTSSTTFCSTIYSFSKRMTFLLLMGSTIKNGSQLIYNGMPVY